MSKRPPRLGKSAGVEGFESVVLEILWSRLIAAADEAAAALVRTSFSTIARESNDLAVVLVDGSGNLIAESSGAIPAFIGTVARTVRHILERFPPKTLRPGDVIITNDPWMGAGHLPDMIMAAPIFRESLLVAFSATVCHMPDIGGSGNQTTAHREVFEEGLRIPPVRYERRGRLDEGLRDVLRANVRVPDLVMGDFRAYRTANETARRRVLQLMEDYALTDLTDLSNAIQAKAEHAMRETIGSLPRGTFRAKIVSDCGLDDPVTCNVAVTTDETGIEVDLAGSSPQVERAVNVVESYTYGMAAYAIKCAIAPTIPNCEGTLRPIRVVAPRGSIFNANFPAAVASRHIVGHLVVQAVFAALAEIIPERVQAASGGIWVGVLSGASASGAPWVGTLFCSGGFGATASLDGHPCLSMPGNVSVGSIEVLEGLEPIQVVRRELRTDSGGPGRQRGGLGEVVELWNVSDRPVRFAMASSRQHYPPAGLLGGHGGAPGHAEINGERVDLNIERVLQPGDRCVLFTPGGGGWGNPRERAHSLVLKDLRDGLISASAAADSYGLSQ
jgi:N-methylhydantoinase B